MRRFDDAERCANEALTLVELTNERLFEADINRIVGEIALASLEPNVARAKTYFEQALAVARRQRAKSWELRAAMSMARLSRDQGQGEIAQSVC
jgi:predicted ATPase